MSDVNASAAIDIKRGKDALVFFHNEALKFPDNYSISFDELLGKLSEMSHEQFLSGFGFAINSTEMADREVRDSMIALADAGEGKLPTKWMDFFNALRKDPTGFSFSALAYTVTESAKDVGVGLQKVGDTAITTLKNASGLITYLPYVAFAGICAYVFFRVKPGRA